MRRIFLSSVLLIIFAVTMTKLIKLYTNKYRRYPIVSSDLSFTHRPYQDIIINNKLIVRGYGPACSSRYNAIKTVLHKFKRPITILDIGAASGYMSFRIANDYSSTCVMISDPETEDISLKKLCELNTSLDNTVLLSKKISADELSLLSHREHFDVVLALNVLNYFPYEDWKRATQAVLKLGDCIIIEVPPIEEKNVYGQKSIPKILEFIEGCDSKLIAKTRHTSGHFGKMYLLKGTKKILHKINLFDYSTIEYDIYCSFIEKFLIKRERNNIGITADLSAQKLKLPMGISLITFKMLNGTYPTKTMIKGSIADLIYTQGSVLLPPECIIIQGRSIALFNDGMKGIDYTVPQNIKLVYNIIDAKDANNTEKIFSLCRRVSDDDSPKERMC